jgi:hypothetical protein
MGYRYLSIRVLEVAFIRSDYHGGMMPIFEVHWTEELWYSATIEADNEEHARQMVFSGEFEWPQPHGFEVQDSVVVEPFLD